MHCLPLDDLCQWNKFQYEVVAEAAEEYSLDNRTFTLGTFNGRRYVYTWLDKQPVILIDNAGQLSEAPDVLGE
jgi:hypothetical protein